MILATHVHLLIFQIENKNYKGIIRMISASKDWRIKLTISCNIHYTNVF